jgi:hypothetical protein
MVPKFGQGDGKFSRVKGRFKVSKLNIYQFKGSKAS